jgi:hypothetical protein
MGRAENEKELWNDVLAAYEMQHTEQNSRWSGLDQKAQATVAVGGIFIGAIFALLRELPSDAPLSMRVVMVVVVLLFVVSSISCLMAMRIRPVFDPPSGQAMGRMADDLGRVKQDVELEARLLLVKKDKARLWSESVTEVEAQLQAKAAHLRRGQLVLFSAIMAVALVTILLLLVK